MGGQIPTFILFFILASKWSETSRNAKKNVSLFEGSNFNFSRGKLIFFQICFKCAKTSRKPILKKIKITIFFVVTFPNAGELNYLVNPAFQKAEAESYWF